MQYRRLGTLGCDVSALGFGAMRLPTKSRAIDEAETIRMIRYAVDRGVDYIDTAYVYHGGKSEVVVGRALADGYRQRVKVATKLPCWEVQSGADFDRLLDIQLERLGTSCIDFYLLHSLNNKTWPKMRSLGVLDWAKEAIEAGRFRHLGFSFHDSHEVFKDIIDAYDWAMCQLQYNYMDIESQAGRKGVRYAASKGIAVVVMEPLLGGKLVNPPGAHPSHMEQGPEEAECRRMGAPVALGSGRGDHGPERDEHDGSGRGERGARRGLPRRSAHG